MQRARVVVVDDHPPLLARVCKILEAQGYDVTGHDSPQVFLARPLPEPPCCVLLDVQMPEVSGLEVQQNLLRRAKGVAVIFMTGVRDVPTTVEAMKGGAVDFLLKPFSDEVLFAAVEKGVQRSERALAAQLQIQRAQERLATLTPREKEVCLLVADGFTSREIGEKLGVAETTVSLHRAHVMSKLAARSVAEVVRLVDLAKSSDGDGAG